MGNVPDGARAQRRAHGGSLHHSRARGRRQRPAAGRGDARRRSAHRHRHLGDFRRENRSSYFSLYGYASGIDVLRFYGFGNETEATEGQEFYRVHATQYLLHPALRVPFGGKWQLSFGPALKTPRTTRTRTNSSTP
jgi:hypothetical protein